MKSKSLLGAIIGDILHTTFSDRHFVYDRNKSLLNEKSKISGYTLITLAVAKYIMENNQLYEGRIEPGRSEKRKELLCKTIIDLAKAHPELEYPDWLKQWLSSDKCVPTKDSDGMTAICFSPLIYYFTAITDLESLLRMSTEAICAINCAKKDDNGYKIFATALYGNVRYDIDVVHDFLASLYNFRWSSELKDLESKYGWKTLLSKAMEPALTVFFQGDNGFRINTPISNIERGIAYIKRIGGLSSLVTPLVTPLVTTLVQISYSSSCCIHTEPLFEEIESIRALLPEDLLKINDDFLGFMEEISNHNSFGQDDDDDDDDESRSGVEPDENGTIPFADIMKLL